MNTEKALTQARRDRLSMLEKGWYPLPSNGKMACLKNWNDLGELTPEIVDAWPASAYNREGERVAMLSSGIKLTDGVLAIDADVDDGEVADAVQDIGMDVFGDAWDVAPMRDSQRSPFLVLFQCPDYPWKMFRTPKFDDDQGGSNMIEVFSSKHGGKFIATHGPHSEGREYRWMDSFEPRAVTPQDLPVVTTAQVDDFLYQVTEMMAAHERLTKRQNSSFHKTSPEDKVRVHDITDETVFDTHEYGELAAYAVRDILSQDEQLHCSATFHDGVPHNNKSRCTMQLDREDNLVVHDFGDDVTHYEVGAERQDPGERATETAARLGAALNRTMPTAVATAIEEAQEAGADTEAFEAMVDRLADDLAFNTLTGAVHYLSSRSFIWSHVSLATVKGTYAHLDLTWEGPRGGQRRFSVAEAWRQLDDKIKVDGVRFNPKTTERIYTEKGDTMANAYFGLGEAPGYDSKATGVLMDFLKHLVPDEDERHWLLDWMAEKYQKPWSRNCAVLFVAAGIQGAGRGTLFGIMDKAFEGYTNVVSESDLIGARFNAFMENGLLVFCNEVGGASWSARRAGYETLKDRVDPTNSQVTIERKGVESYRTETYASFMLATNNPGGLTMDAEDRRFAIITNGGKLEGELLQRIIEVGRDALAGQLKLHLVEREVTSKVTDAPMFEGREAMLTANDTDLDEAIGKVVASRSQEYASWIRSDFERAVKLEMTGSDQGKVPGLRNAISQLVGRRAERAGVELLQKRVYVGDMPLAVLTKNADLFWQLSPAEREKVVRGKEPNWEGTNVTPLK